ncbi:GTPase Era [Clostridiaceae bacterium HSG29]|nr:GTPase Era [Clostridiaceae bacterium HSG29]
MSFKSGFVTIIGRTNVGKSTLINKIIQEKLLIVSDKPQTTRNKISAIYNGKKSQIVFLDTPGMHKPKNKYSEQLVRTTKSTLGEVDVVMFMIDSSTIVGPGDKYIIEILKTVSVPVILVINKTDLVSKSELVTLMKIYEGYSFIKDIVCISALNDTNIRGLIKVLESYMPEGPEYYPRDMIIDQTERKIASELIREKLLMYLQDEIPHGVFVKIDKMKERTDKKIIDIDATIICEKKSHKGIIIGKNGRKLKGIGKSAREDIERMLDMKVFLTLWVKVKKDWRNSEFYLRNLE